MFEQIIQSMEASGYQRLQLNVSDIHLYVKNQCQYIFVATTDEGHYPEEIQIKGIITQLQSKLHEKNPNSTFLCIIVTNNLEDYRSLAQMNCSLWFIDTIHNRLMMYENQQDCNQTLREQIESLLDYRRTREKQNALTVRERVRQAPICCTAIVAVNVIIFLFMDLLLSNHQYQFVIDRMGSLWSAVRYEGQYYRFITSLFIHSGVQHLFNNMIVLFFVGKSLESVLSKLRFLIVYFGAGIIADVFSMGYNMINGRYVVSVGASGAIFGLVGAMLYIVLINKGRLQEMSTRQILLFVVFSLYGGFTSGNVDNAAHIGGFLAGVILAVILYRKPKSEV